MFSRTPSPSPSSSPSSFSSPGYSKKHSRHTHTSRYHKNTLSHRRRQKTLRKKGSLTYSRASSFNDRMASEQASALTGATSAAAAAAPLPSDIPSNATSSAPLQTLLENQVVPPPPQQQYAPEYSEADILPPVNINSLREIELQEIIKNPQLRHDIVFDPQLQFRPNLDGERGRRKKLVTEFYWTSVVAECEALAATSTPEEASVIIDAPTSKLRSLFITLRDILDSLLPVRDREHVDSILDPELLIQRLRQCVLDFSALANWIAMVFKAHCAPMRDSWVDQMVARVEQGVSSQSPQRIVEGLRMMFAILEAMKLDVANHQIRTLRPVMVENAIDFELDYYTQMIEKGKFDLNDSLQWYSNNLNKYIEKKQKKLGNTPVRRNLETYRSAFVHGLVMLLSCASDEIVTEFPTTFAFDFARLAGFRAEVRQIVCINICILHFSQLLRSHLAKKAGLNNFQKKTLLNKALSTANIEKMKKDILAIVGDDYGNSKWTKNTSNLALELAKRVELASTPSKASTGFNSKGEQEEEVIDTTNIVPSEDLIDMVSNLLVKNMQPKSPLYKVVESKIIESLMTVCSRSMNAIAGLDKPPSLAEGDAFVIRPPCTTSSTSAMISSDPEVVCQREILAVASKALLLTHFHWEVFSKFYVQYAAIGDEEDLSSTYSSSTMSDGERAMKRSKSSNKDEATVISNQTADNEITQSL